MHANSPYIRALIDEGGATLDRRNITSVPARKAMLVLMSPYLAVKHARRQPEPEILDYTEMFVTSYCSLKCRWCSASIPYYLNKYHIDADFLLRQERAYLNAIDGVERFRLLGGDPLLHPDLAKIMRPLVESPKIHTLHLVTGGSVIPKDPEVLELLRNKKVYMDISNYGKVSSKVPELREMEAAGQLQLIVDTVTEWFVPNHNYEDKGLTDEQVAKRYKACPDWCHVLRDGKLFYCGEAFHIANIPDTPMDGTDYVELLDTKKSPKQLRREINDLIFKRNPTMKACSRCVGSFMHKDRCLVAGEQLKPGESMPYVLPADIPVVSTKKI